MDEQARLLELLKELIGRSGRPQREIERALGVGHGWLRLLLTGKSELKMRHLFDLAPLLGFTPAQFFHQAYPEAEGRETEPVRPSVDDLLPGERQHRQLSARTRLEVREIFLAELAKLGTRPPGGEES